MTCFIKKENGIVIQKDIYEINGFIAAPDYVVCGMIDNGDGTYSNPKKDKTASEVSDNIWNLHNMLIVEGILFDGFRHGGSGGHREYIATQYNLIKAGIASQYGTTLRDSYGADQQMNDAKLCALYEKGADYVSKINQAAMAAEDSLQSMTQEQLNSFDPEVDISWPSNIYTYP